MPTSPKFQFQGIQTVVTYVRDMTASAAFYDGGRVLGGGWIVREAAA